MKESIITNSHEVVEGQIMDFILDIVQSYLSVDEDYYRRKSRKREVVFARQVAMFLIKKHTKKLSLNNIGQKFGGKDHATVLHSVKTIKNLIEVDKHIRNTVNDIDKIVKFKSSTITENLNLDKDYYYIDLSNFVSMKLLGQKNILLAGFTPEEIKDFADNLKAVIELKEHENTGMYILEKRQKNDGQKGEQEEK